MNNLNITVTDSNASRYFRCADRAKGLLSEGYQFEAFADDATSFYCTSPAGTIYILFTHVNCPTFHPKCNCPDFVKNGDFCKHLLQAGEILKDEAEMWEAICAEVDAQEVA